MEPQPAERDPGQEQEGEEAPHAQEAGPAPPARRAAQLAEHAASAASPAEQAAQDRSGGGQQLLVALALLLGLEDLGAIEGLIPDGAGGLEPDEFRAAAIGWLSPRLHGNRPQ